MVPTVVDPGMPDLVSAAFYGLVAPAGVPGAVVERLNGLCLEILKDEGVKQKLAELGLVTTGSTPRAFLEKVKFETERWAKIVKENDIKVEG
jgi:tripartite-type tricarboxylate transporter receptor subunit TctC